MDSRINTLNLTSVTLAGFRFVLKENSKSQKKKRQYLFTLITKGEIKISNIEESGEDGIVFTGEEFKFDKLPAESFKIDLRIYVTKQENLSAMKKAKEFLMGVSHPTTSQFKLCCLLQITSEHLGDGFHRMVIQNDSDLSGFVRFRLNYSSITDNKKLHLGEILNVGRRQKDGLLIWNYMWCVLDNKSLLMYNFPVQELFSDPDSPPLKIEDISSAEEAIFENCFRTKTVRVVGRVLGKNEDFTTAEYLLVTPNQDSFQSWKTALLDAVDLTENNS